MKISTRILMIVVMVICSLSPLASLAQLDARAMSQAQQRGESLNMGGANPFDTGEEDGQTQDSTKTIRIRKPLESYYFNDSIRALPNFMWTVSREMNDVNIMPLDTTITNWRIDYPYYLEGTGDMTLGALGQSTLPFNYFHRPTSPDFTFAQSYDAYTYRMENVPFYNSKTPYLNFTYLESGQKRYREEHFEITTAHNISPTTGFNVSYKSRGTKGLYDWQRTTNHNLSAAFSHTGKRYSIHAAYMHNTVDTRENGGVVGEWAIADTVFEMPSGVPMRLASAEAENHYRNNAFFVKQAYAIPLERVTEYDFSLADLSAVFIGHQFEFNTWSKVYTDKRATYTNERGQYDDKGNYTPTTHEYYENWYIDPKTTRDSISERLISNKLYVQIQPWDRNGAVSTIDAGVGLDLHTYSYLNLENYIAGKMTRDHRTSWYAYGATGGHIKRYADWGVDVQYYPSGYRGGDLSVGADITLRAYIREHPLILRSSALQATGRRIYSQTTMRGLTLLVKSLRLVSR